MAAFARFATECGYCKKRFKTFGFEFAIINKGIIKAYCQKCRKIVKKTLRKIK